jgi:hypothetical protein
MVSFRSKIVQRISRCAIFLQPSISTPRLYNDIVGKTKQAVYTQKIRGVGQYPRPHPQFITKLEIQ